MDTDLVNWAAGSHDLRLERDWSEGLLVLSEIVPEQVQQRFRLLRADVDALEVFHLDFIGGVLADDAEDEEEVPHAHAGLDAVGVAIAVLIGASCDDAGLVGGLLGLTHSKTPL
jgi:hypothetical protein